MKKILTLLIVVIFASMLIADKLPDLPTIATVADDDSLYIWDKSGAVDNSIGALELGEYILGNAEIGGTASGDIITIDGVQILTEKKLTSPKINDTTIITSNGKDINILSGSDAAGLTNIEIEYVNGVTSAIQTQLDAKADESVTDHCSYAYIFAWTAAGTPISEVILEATIRSQFGWSTSRRIVPQVQLELWEDEGGGSWGHIAKINFAIDATTVGADVYLEQINIDAAALTASTNYRIIIICKYMDI